MNTLPTDKPQNEIIEAILQLDHLSRPDIRFVPSKNKSYTKKSENHFLTQIARIYNALVELEKMCNRPQWNSVVKEYRTMVESIRLPDFSRPRKNT